MENDGADIELEASAILASGIEFLGEAAVEAVLPGGEIHPLFTGVVNTVDFVGDSATLSLVGFERELSEIHIGGLVSEGVKAVELIYCLLRLSGIPDERMDLDGWTGSDPGVFLVAAPLEGIVVSSVHEVLGAMIGPANPAQVQVEAGELRERYTAANCWGSATVHAGSLFEAEQLGLEVIDDALCALHSLCSYSYSTLRGTPRPYLRDRARLQPRRADVVFTGSVTTQRQWLRTTSASVRRPALDVGAELEELTAVDPNERIRLALREWSRAANSDTPFARVTHLWRAVELYARGAAAQALFGQHDIAAVRGAIASIDGLGSVQRKRLDQLVSGLNDAPLLARLRAALDRDGIAVGDAEMDLLKATRQLRNALEHARHITPLEDRRLAQALGLVNRILVAAASRTDASQDLVGRPDR